MLAAKTESIRFEGMSKYFPKTNFNDEHSQGETVGETGECTDEKETATRPPLMDIH